jgi:YD repeat-containing protein
MSDRDRNGLRGPVRSCTEESTHPGTTDSEGRTYSQVRFKSMTEYDAAGRVKATGNLNSDGSEWTTHYNYDASGRLLKIASGVEGQVMTEITYSYDHQGRLQSIRSDERPENPITFLYDELGRKNKTQTSRPEDYRPNVAMGGSPFEVADREAPNLPGGGSATTVYDERDRPIEVQVRDAAGDLVNQAVRTYDEQGHILEEKQILNRPSAMFPPEALAKIQGESGIPMDQLRQELEAQFTKLMAGQSPYSVSYSYDSNGRTDHMRRRVFNQQEDAETLYNEYGDVASETTRSTRLGELADSSSALGLPEYSEVRYSYKYDDHENWVEKAVSYRSSPDGALQSSTVTRRTLTYY